MSIGTRTVNHAADDQRRLWWMRQRQQRKAKAAAPTKAHPVEQLVYLPPTGFIARSLFANVIGRR